MIIDCAIKKEVCILKNMEEKMHVVYVWLPAHLEYNRGMLSGLPEISPGAFLRPTMSAIV